MSFGEYGVAMERKLAIAAYHLDELSRASTDPDEHGLPPIPLQAHFEAAGRAIASIPDQLATGIVEVLEQRLPGLPGPSAAYLHSVVKPLPAGELRDLLEEVGSDLRYCDLRSWRNRATHRFDRKAAMEGEWIVESSEECDIDVEPRDVVGYIATMLEYGRTVVAIAPEAESNAFQLRDRL
jgi:hypothetical protein